MDFEYKESLLSAVASGEVVLFLGAGAVAGSTVGKEKNNSYLGSELAEKLLKTHFPKDKLNNDKLKRVVTDIVNIDGKESLVTSLCELLLPVIPSSALKMIPTINWPAIFTVNVDDSLEQSYAAVEDKAQELVLVVQPRDKIAENKNMEVSCYKLHGCLSIDPKNVIFTQKDYTESRDKYYKLFSSLKTELCDKPFLFVGFAFEDEDFIEIWEDIKKYADIKKRHHNTFLVWPNPPERFVKSMKSEGVTVIDSTTQEFIPWLKANLPQKAKTIKEKVALVANPIKRLIESECSISVSPELLFKVNSFCEIVSHIPNPSKIPENSRFYVGGCPDWDDIKLGLPINRKVQEGIVDDLEAWLQEKGVKSDLILGSNGYGKTTLLMSLADLFVKKYGLMCLWISDHIRFDPVILLELVKTVGRPCAVFVDDAYKCTNSIKRLISDSKSNKLDIYLFASSRPSDWNTVKQTSTAYKPNIIPLERLCEEEANGLAAIMKKSGKLSQQYSSMSTDSLAEYYLIEAERHIIAGLMTSVHGQGQRFDEIIANEYFRIESEIAKETYLITSLIHSLDHDLPIELYFRIIGLEFDAYTDICPMIDGIVLEKCDNSTGNISLRTQHRVIAECLVEKIIGPINASEILLKIGKSINQHSRKEAEILIRLSDESYLEKILKEPGYIRNYYDALVKEYPSDPFIQQHWAIYESKNDNYEKAKTLIDSSLTLIDKSSKFYFHFINTKGMIWLREAISEENPAKAEYLMKKGSSFIREQIKVDPDNEIHYISLIDKLISWAQKKIKKREDKINIYEEIETDLEDALRRYPNSSELLALSGRLETELSNLPEAAELLKKSLSINQGNLKARILLARICINSSEFSSAIKLIDEGLGLSPKSSALRKLKVQCVVKTNAPWTEVKLCAKEYLKLVVNDLDLRLYTIKRLIENNEIKEANDNLSILKKVDLPYRTKILAEYELVSNNDQLIVSGTYKCVRLLRGFLDIDGYPKHMNAYLDLQRLQCKGKFYDGTRIKAVVGLNGMGLYVKKII